MSTFAVWKDEFGTHRAKVIEFNGELGMEVRWTGSCTGCYESEDGHPVGEYPVHPKHGCHVGAGCHECGYHGVAMQRHWVPLPSEAITALRARRILAAAIRQADGK